MAPEMADRPTGTTEPAPAPVDGIPGREPGPTGTIDEGPRIATVVRGTVAHVPAYVVDDGSSDDTAERATEAGAIVMVQRPNRGKGAALRTGFARAIADGADAVVTLDADGQHDPTEIPRFRTRWAVAPSPGRWGATSRTTSPATAS